MLAVLEVILGILLFFFGASIFSFLNVVIYRLPKKQSFVTGRSMCPGCGHVLRGRDMVPVLNWFYLRGKCRDCGARISIRYPLVETLGGVCALLCTEHFGLNIQAVITFALLCFITVIAFIDKDTMEIPNGLSLAIALLGIVSIWIFPQVTILQRVIGAFCVSVPLLALTLIIPGGFGGGDIKLMAAAGIFLGWKLNLLALFIGILIGGSYGIWLLAVKHADKKSHFAFGPCLCIGIGTAWFWGEWALNWYLGLFGL